MGVDVTLLADTLYGADQVLGRRESFGLSNLRKYDFIRSLGKQEIGHAKGRRKRLLTINLFAYYIDGRVFELTDSVIPRKNKLTIARDILLDSYTCKLYFRLFIKWLSRDTYNIFLVGDYFSAFEF